MVNLYWDSVFRSPPTTMTLEIWVKPSSVYADASQDVLCSSGTDGNYALSWESPTGTFAFSVWNGALESIVSANSFAIIISKLFMII